MLYETYIELVMASALSIVAIYSKVDADHPSVWFETFDDALNSVVAHVVLLASCILPVMIFYQFQFQGGRMKKSWFGRTMIEILEDINLESKVAKVYIIFSINKRML